MPSRTTITSEKYLLPAERLELERVLQKYRGSALRNTTMLLLMLQTGARPQEILNLTWRDIDLVEATVYLKTLKKGHPRYLPIGSDLVSRLDDMGGLKIGPVFNIRYNMFRLIWCDYRPVKKKLHCLRHTFAVDAYHRTNYNLKLIQKSLGHKDLMTTGIYLDFQVNLDELRKALC